MEETIPTDRGRQTCKEEEEKTERRTEETLKRHKTKHKDATRRHGS